MLPQYFSFLSKIYINLSVKLPSDNPNILCRDTTLWLLIAIYTFKMRIILSLLKLFQIIRLSSKLMDLFISRCYLCFSAWYSQANRHREGITTAFKRTHIRINNSLDTIFSLRQTSRSPRRQRHVRQILLRRSSEFVRTIM